MGSGVRRRLAGRALPCASGHRCSLERGPTLRVRHRRARSGRSGKRSRKRRAAPTKSAPSRRISPRRLPGRSASTGTSSRKAERGARRRLRGLERERVGERMADEHGVDAVPGVDRRFERKQAKHQIGAAADLRGAFRAPGPDRWADVVNGADARRLSLRSSPKLKSGASMPMKTSGWNASTRRRTSRRSARSRGRCRTTSASPITASSSAECHASSPAPACAGRRRRRTLRREAFAQCGDQARTEQIARGFSGDDEARGGTGKAGSRDSGFGIRRGHDASGVHCASANGQHNAGSAKRLLHRYGDIPNPE